MFSVDRELVARTNRIDVLILVLLEDVLSAHVARINASIKGVLILVLLEDVLSVQAPVTDEVVNPVLILVLLEDVLSEQTTTYIDL